MTLWVEKDKAGRTHSYVIVDSHRPAIELDQSVNSGQFDSQLPLVLAVPVRALNQVEVIDGVTWGRSEGLVLPEAGICRGLQLAAEIVVQMVRFHD